MTSDRRARSSSTVRPAGPKQLRRRSREILLVGALLALAVPAGPAWHGTIVEVVRGGQGLPVGVRFGETMLLRYKFTPPLAAPCGLPVGGASLPRGN